MKPTERPILFSTEMVQAILFGIKNQTRRAKALEEINENPDDYSLTLIEGDLGYFRSASQEKDIVIRCEYGGASDILWVRESFTKVNGEFLYKADLKQEPEYKKLHSYKPSIHMPKEACRIKLKITSINAQRLHDITNEDSRGEGVLTSNGSYFNYISKAYNKKIPRTSFFSLWEKINGKKSLKSNPWVWVVKFKIINTTH